MKKSSGLVSTGLLLSAILKLSIQDSFAQSLRDQLVSQAQNSSAAQVFTRLKGTGYASCRVYVGGASSYCHHYFVTVSNSKKYQVGGVTYNGFPRYQNDTPPSSGNDNRYAPPPYRNSNPAGAIQASSGCFAGSGGAKSGGVCWGGNNDDECSLNAENYAKTMLIRMLQDTAYDPCDVGGLETALASGFSQNTDDLLTGGKLFRSGVGACKIKIDTNKYTSELDKKVCQPLFARAKVLSITLQAAPTSGIITVPLPSNSGYAAYRTSLTNEVNSSIGSSLQDVTSSGSGLGALKLPSSSSSSGSGSQQP